LSCLRRGCSKDKQQRIGFADFEIEILMSKMHFVLVGLFVENVNQIFQKIEENRHVTAKT